MLSYQIAAVCLCTVVSAERLTQQSQSVAPDFTDAVAKMKEVDRHHNTDLFTIFETDGEQIVEAISPPPSACSLTTMKAALLECPKRGKVCIALYKFNYPMSIGSSTLKGKSVLVQSQDKEGMKAPLGGFFKVTKVSMAVVQFIWGPLKNDLSKNSVSPAAILELSDSSDLEELDAESIWQKIKAGAGRVDGGEEAAFVKHVNDQIAKAAGAPPAQTSVTSDASEEGAEEKRPIAKPIVPAAAPQPAAVAPVDVQRIVKEVEEAVSKSVEKTSRQIAREEVGNAIRKLGTDVGEATRNVGKTWLDKSRGN